MAQVSRAYARKVKLSNLQQMAQTICYVQEHNFDSIEELHQEHNSMSVVIDKLSDSISRIDRRINSHDYSDSSERARLIQIRDTLHLSLKNLCAYSGELDIVCSNVDTILHREIANKRDFKLKYSR